MKLKWADPVELDKVNEGLDLDGRNGVYVIWLRSSEEISVVYTGKGDIAARFAEHAGRKEIANLAKQPESGRDTIGNGTIMFTWAFVSPEANRVGIERYLSDVFKPKFGIRSPLVHPIPVNLPPLA